MTGGQALDEIKRLAARHQIVITNHAEERMQERGAQYEDVREALLTATSASWQNDRRNWRVEGGVDTDGDDLTVIVKIAADAIVITIF